MKKTLMTTILAASLGVMTASAQCLSIDNNTIDIGQVPYKQPTTVTYTLKNKSTKTVKIVNVETGCGCTTATYPMTPIAPGEECRVAVTTDNKQLGHFFRYILIHEDSGEDPLELEMYGQVVMQVENYSGEYPLTLGSLLADDNNIEFDDVHKGNKVSKDIHIMNPTGQYVEPVVLRTPPYLTAEISPARIAPKQGGVLRISLDSHKLRSYGLTQTSIYLASAKGEKIGENKEITVSTVLLPPHIATDQASHMVAPKIQLSSTEIDMTDFAGKSKKKEEITIQNVGKSDLNITSMQMFTTGLQVTLPKRNLKPGETVKMKVTGIASQLKNVRTRPRILMITNDPDNQKVVIEIKK